MRFRGDSGDKCEVKYDAHAHALEYVLSHLSHLHICDDRCGRILGGWHTYRRMYDMSLDVLKDDYS